MTRYASPTLYQCPACAGNFKHYTLQSLFFDAGLPDWSDGKNANWWALASGSVGRCPSCISVVWIEDAVALMPAPSEPRPMARLARIWHRVTGDKRGRLREQRDWLALPAGIRQAERISGLHDAHDLIDALAALPPDALDREIHLRRRLWWSSNDHLRGRYGVILVALPRVAEDVGHANALRLLELIEHDPKRQVERGELLRQLGRFDDAVAVLNAVKPDGYSEVKAVKIERLALAGIVELRDLKAAPHEPVPLAHTTQWPKAGARVW